MEMIYKRTAHYHETDQMAIVHHSNYIKWLEEARVYLMNKAGVPYSLMEAEGVLSPVLGVSIEYKRPVLFEETVYIHVEILEYTGVRFNVSYRVTNEDESVLHATGSSKHCFVSKTLRPVSLKKKYVKMHQLFEQVIG